MKNNQKAAVHLIAIPIQIVAHSKVDSTLKQNNVGLLGRGIAQAILFGIGLWVHNTVKNS